MNKAQKLEYQQKIEKYFEEHQVYDTFERLMKLLVKEKPDEPLDFLIAKLERAERKTLPNHSKTHICGGAGRGGEEGEGVGAC